MESVDTDEEEDFSDDDDFADPNYSVMYVGDV